MKIFFHVPREDWFVDRMGNEFATNSKFDVTFTDLQDCDVVWLAAAWCWKQLPLKVLEQKPVLCTVHHEVPEKFDSKRATDFAARDKIVTAYHVPCLQTAAFISDKTTKNVWKVGYWVNTDLWCGQSPVLTRAQLQLSDKMFVIGSFQRDTEGTDLKAPKFEKGPDKFCDYVIDIKRIIDSKNDEHLSRYDDVVVLLSGHRRQYVISRLRAVGIRFVYVELPTLKTLANLYRACDEYAVTARYEGGPQSILECAIQRVPCVSTNVGMATDVLHQNSILKTISTNDRCIPYFPTDDEVEHAFNNATKFALNKHVKFYDEMLERVFSLKNER